MRAALVLLMALSLGANAGAPGGYRYAAPPLGGDAEFDSLTAGNITASGAVSGRSWTSTESTASMCAVTIKQDVLACFDNGFSAWMSFDGTEFDLNQPLHVDGYVVGADAGFNNITASGNVGLLNTGASLCFGSASAQCLQYGGANTIQTGANVSLAIMGNAVISTDARVSGRLVNPGSGANCSGFGSSLCFDDSSGYAWTNGSGTTVGVATTTGLISGDVGISSGGFGVNFLGVVSEGANGQGAYTPLTVGRGSKFRNVACTCRVAGTGGTNGVELALMEGGVSVATAVLVGSDSNVCNDAAGTVLVRDFNYTMVAGANYSVQVTTNTDCTVNPTDCSCNVDITR